MENRKKSSYPSSLRKCAFHHPGLDVLFDSHHRREGGGNNPRSCTGIPWKNSSVYPEQPGIRGQGPEGDTPKGDKGSGKGGKGEISHTITKRTHTHTGVIEGTRIRIVPAL